MKMEAEILAVTLKEIVSVCIGISMKVLGRIVFAAFTCILALGGSIVGTIVGGIKGQRSETGMLDGAGKGAVSGAIAALQVLDFIDLRQPMSKVALLTSLFNGKIIMECVYSGYQWHNGIAETIYREVSDICDMRGIPGLPLQLIQSLPLHPFNTKMKTLYNESSCSICFQEFEDGDVIRMLPKCDHVFHFNCIDKWLFQQGSCPMCRTHVLEDQFYV